MMEVEYTLSKIQSANITLTNLTLSHNKARDSGGGISTRLSGNGHVTLIVSNCYFFNETGLIDGGGMYIEDVTQSAYIILNNLTLLDNSGGGFSADLDGNGNVTLAISECDFINGTALNHQWRWIEHFCYNSISQHYNQKYTVYE